jgi:hypothetical protein
MNFFKDLFDSFVPHADNDYKPHFFRVKSFLILLIAIVLLGLLTVFLQRTIIEKSDYLAAVISSAIVDLTNTDRRVNNLEHLAVNPLLERAAQMKADDMAKNSYFAHTSPAGVTPWHWFKEAGYAFAYAGENLAIRFSDSVDVERAWMNSPTHRANILNSHFTEIGIGIAQGVYDGQPTVFVVQMFGAPSVKQAFPGFLSSTQTESTQATTTPAVSGATTTPVAQASSTPVAVKGAEAEVVPEEEPVPADEPSPKVILEDDTFIAVKSDVATASPLSIEPSAASETLVQKIVTSPKSAVETIYLVLASVIALALAVMIGIEIKRQHPKNVALGVILIVLMIALLYLGQFFGPGSLLVL